MKTDFFSNQGSGPTFTPKEIGILGEIFKSQRWLTRAGKKLLDPGQQNLAQTRPSPLLLALKARRLHVVQHKISKL